MPAYAFESITADEARNLRLGDSLTIRAGSARDVQVVYQSVDPLALTPEVPSILLTVGGHTVAFSTNLTELSRLGFVTTGDGSLLYVGNSGAERVVGAAHDDALYGGAGADTIYGGQGDDVIWTGLGDESGPVRLMAGSGRADGDFAHGNMGDDEIHGSYGNDTLYGGQGDDTIDGGDGDDLIFGDLGDDWLFGGLGADRVFGGDGNDTVNGGFGSDTLSGGAGEDILTSSGPDPSWLDGGDGADTLLAAAAGSDTLIGGAGRDLFEIVAMHGPARGQDDVIYDWDASDRITFPGVFATEDGPGGGLVVRGGEGPGNGPGLIGGGPAGSILPREYSEFVASSYEEALRIANEHIMFTGAKWVAAQVGHDVIVFGDAGDPEDGADAAVVLMGRTLADVSLLNFF